MKDTKARHHNQVKRHRKQGKMFFQRNDQPLEPRFQGAVKKSLVRARLILRRRKSDVILHERPLHWIRQGESYYGAVERVRLEQEHGHQQL